MGVTCCKEFAGYNCWATRIVMDDGLAGDCSCDGSHVLRKDSRNTSVFGVIFPRYIIENSLHVGNVLSSHCCKVVVGCSVISLRLWRFFAQNCKRRMVYKYLYTQITLAL